jgi:ABC-type transport system involved in multi-copper enzyme maturation permease subunit
MSFWDIVWFIFISFAFVAYLMVMFYILTDLFRDRDTSGVMKAVWIIFLIFLPVLTSLVSLIVRGQGMQKRSLESAAEMRRQQDAYIREVATSSGGASAADQIAQAKSMLDSGAITQSEYETLKAKALA